MCDSFTFFTILLISEFHMGFCGGIKLLCGDQCCVHSGKACLEGDIGHSKRVVIFVGVCVFTRAEHVVEANCTKVHYRFVNFRQFCIRVFFRFWSVFVCLSVLTMSFPAPCADSAHPPGMLTCHIAPLCLPKQNGTVLVIAFPRFPHLTSTTLWHRVFVVIKIAMHLVVCFLQRHFEHQWQHHGAAMMTITKLKSPRNSFGMLSHTIPKVSYQFQVIITNNIWKMFCL